MRRLGLGLVVMLGTVWLTGCACCPTPTPSVFGILPHDRIEKALHDNPLGATEDFKITTLDRDNTSSYHLVQLRTKERLHRHNMHDGKVLIWKGGGTLLLDGKPVTLKERDVVEIPRGVPHCFINESGGPTIAVVQFTPRLDGRDTEYLDGKSDRP